MSLTPPSGYVLHIAQISGGKPRSTIDCMACPWAATLDLPLDGDDTATGAVVYLGIVAWQGHPCAMPHAGSGMGDTSGGTG